MAKTCDVTVTVSQLVQLNKFEPLTISLTETRHEVPVEKAAKLRDELYDELLLSVMKKIKRAIKEYRERA